ncbi:MAG: hypothetical protein KH128_08505 [Firmicutes bacterium]|nr:hypothetical protein [Bacillota bacterium]
MKKWTKRIGTALCALWLVLPMPVLAAGKDGITFEKRDGGSVSVTISADGASAEKVTAAAVQLKVTVTEGQADISFEFAEKIPADVTGSRYENGILYVYAASDEPIFDEKDELFLGTVVMKAKTEHALATVEVISETVSDGQGQEDAEKGYSFQTANTAYGMQERISDEIPEAAELSAGEGSNGGEDGNHGNGDDNGSEDGNGNGNGGADGNGGNGSGSENNGGSGNGGSGNGENSENGSNQGGADGSHGNDGGKDDADGGSENIQQGLNDTTVQQVTNPDEAVKIPTTIVAGTPEKAPLPDLSQNAAAEPGAGKTQGSKDKVTVVKPAEGPSAILVEEDVLADGKTEAGEQEISGEEETAASGKNEIALDQENGGTLDDTKTDKIPLIAAGAAAVTAVAGAAAGLALWRRNASAGKKSGKRKKK